MPNLKDRLAFYRKSATEKHQADWRDAFKVAQQNRETYPAAYNSTVYNPRTQWPRDHARPTYKHCRWVERTAQALRFVGLAHDLIRLNHTGWYSDNIQEETYQGAVYQLPAAPDGSERFAYGYNDPNNKGAAFLCFDLDASDKEEAARMADGFAESLAEAEREYQATESASFECSELTEEISDARKDILALIREAKAGCAKLADLPAIKEAIRDKVGTLIQARQDAFTKRANLQADPYHYINQR